MKRLYFQSDWGFRQTDQPTGALNYVKTRAAFFLCLILFKNGGDPDPNLCFTALSLLLIFDWGWNAFLLRRKWFKAAVLIKPMPRKYLWCFPFLIWFCVLITVPVDVFAPNSAWSGFYEYLGKRQTTTFTVTGFNATSGRVNVTLLESSGVSIRLSGKNTKCRLLSTSTWILFFYKCSFSVAVRPFLPQANRFLGHWKQRLWKTPPGCLRKLCFTALPLVFDIILYVYCWFV